MNSKKRILVVEDEPHVLELLCLTLEFDGFEVHTESDGACVLAKLRALHPHLLLLDMMLPGMSGLEILDLVRADIELRHIPVVILSAGGVARDIEEAKLRGVTEYMVKPFDPETLSKRLRRILEKG